MKCPVCQKEVNFVLPSIDGTKAFFCSACELSGTVTEGLNGVVGHYHDKEGELITFKIEE